MNNPGLVCFLEEATDLEGGRIRSIVNSRFVELLVPEDFTLWRHDLHETVLAYFWTLSHSVAAHDLVVLEVDFEVLREVGGFFFIED